jgi:hypothetical protein
MVSVGEQRIYQADWSLLDSGDRMYQPDIAERLAGLNQVDTLDVASLASERDHAYSWWNGEDVAGYATEAKQLRYRFGSDPDATVLDGGRLMTGGEAFTIRTLPGQDLWIAMRTHPQNGAGLRVFVDGKPAGVWRYSQAAGYWLETLFRVPAELITGEHTHLRFEAIADDPGFKWHSPFYYWFFQGQAQSRAPVPSRTLQARFGHRIELLGFDAPSQSLRPGQPVEVTTYWRATQSADASYKLFAHLIDSRGTLRAQSDGVPVFDTRGTDTWAAGEVIADRRTLDLPANLEPGVYKIKVGLYRDAEPYPRLPITQTDQDHGDNALTLTEIHVE